MRIAPWLVSLAAFLPSLQTAHARDACRTVEHVEAPGERSCTCAARSAGALNFYWRIPVQAGRVYRCEMDSPFRGHVQVLQDKCTVPEGVTLRWESCCSFEPAVAEVDTRGMQAPQGDAVIKFQVGASDIPSDVHITCSLQHEEA